MTGWIRLAAATAASAVVLLWSQAPTVKGQQPRAQVSQAVRAAAAQNGSARVIVGLRVGGYRAEGGLAAAAAADQRASIQSASQRVLGRLPLAASTRARTFDFIPYFNATVDANTLLQLEADPDVISI